MKRMLPALLMGFAIAAIAVTTPAHGQTFSPLKGQTAEQQSQDVAECRAIAAQQSGFDPAGAPAAAASPPPAPRGERVRGAARGAAVGAAAGSISGDADKGAAAGAVAGTVAGGVRTRQARRGQQAAAQQQQVASAQAQANYGKALAACMQGKGYAVK